MVRVNLKSEHFACCPRRVRKFSPLVQNLDSLDEMKTINRWAVFSTDVNVHIKGNPREARECVVDMLPKQSRLGLSDHLNLSSDSGASTRNDPLLLQKLRDRGFDDICIADVRNCSEELVTVLWKLLSHSHGDSRFVENERENAARAAHDNKILSSKMHKLSVANERLISEISSLESVHRKKESELLARIAFLEQNRSEWEKCAIQYKSRESKFAAEIRRHANQYDELQHCVSRTTRSVGPTSSHHRKHRIEFN